MRNELKDLVICGAGGLGREIADLIKRDYADTWNLIGFVDPNPNLPADIDGIPLLPENYLESHETAVVIGIASPERKRALWHKLAKSPKLYFPNIISKKASIATKMPLACGIVIQDFCLVSVNVILEDLVFLNTCVTLGHDVHIGQACSIMPQCAVSGFVKVGCETFIGAHSFIMQGKTIGNDVTIAAGTVVCRDVCDGGMAMGNPAKVLKRK